MDSIVLLKWLKIVTLHVIAGAVHGFGRRNLMKNDGDKKFVPGIF